MVEVLMRTIPITFDDEPVEADAVPAQELKNT
jgi:hypothetical protein